MSRQHWRNGYWQSAVVGCLGIFACIDTIAVAQITPDGSLGAEGSTVTRDVVIRGTVGDRIDGGAIRGTNLFHSFEQFNIDAGRAAYFTNPAGIQNILSRVTGRDPSNILGRLGVLGSANLFFINPNGILFGPNASLDVGGSFVATTASAVQFGEQGSFSATNSEAPGLLTVNPSTFFFNQLSAGAIVNQSVARNLTNPSFIEGLRVPNGQNLVLLGGNVTIDGGRLNAFRGRVEIGAVAGTGTVGLNPDGSLNFPTNTQRADVIFTNGAQVDVSLNNSGSIAVTARNIDILEGSVLVAGIDSRSSSTNSQAGDITLDATEAIQLDNQSAVGNLVTFGSTGNAGDIRINTGSLSVTNGAQFVAITNGQGNAGNIVITARDRVLFDGVSANGVRSGAFSTVQPGAIGQGGDIEISTGSLLITNRALLSSSTLGQGDAGNLFINARDTVSFLNDSSALAVINGGVGDGGNIYVNTGSLFLTNGSQLDTSLFNLGRGNAGNIIVNARDIVSLDGTNASGTRASTLYSEVDAGGVGNGGNVIVNTGSLFATNGAQLEASTEGQGNAGNVIVNARDVVRFDGTSRDGQILSGALSNVTGDAIGAGGNIEITTGSLFVTNGAQLDASTEGQGSAGNIIINARDHVSFAGVSPDGRRSSAAFSRLEEDAVGDGGNIEITTRTLSISDGAQLQAQTMGQGNAGNVIINASESVTLDGFSRRILGSNSSGGLLVELFPSSIFTDVGQAASGNGGDIRITTGVLSLANGAVLDNNTSGRGNAGSVMINARDAVLIDVVESSGLSSAILSYTATQAEGRGGTVAIDTSSFHIANGAFINARTGNSNRGGDVIINADTFEAINGGQVVTTSLNSGQAGSITLNVRDRITLSGSDPDFEPLPGTSNRFLLEGNGESGLFASTRPNSTANGGTITVQTNSLTLTDGAQISAISQGAGQAGDVRITADAAVRLIDSDITTSAGQASGGAITINANTIRLYGDSDIRTNVESGNNNGGNITLKANSILALADSDILAFAQDGRGGNVLLETPAFFGQNYRPAARGTDPATLDNNDRVDINASGAISGVITLPDTSFIQNSLTQLSQALIDTGALVANSCIVRSRQQGSSFLITGSGGLPVRPGDAAVSTFPTGTIRSVANGESEQSSAPARRAWRMGDPIVEPQGVYRLPDGRLVLSRECED